MSNFYNVKDKCSEVIVWQQYQRNQVITDYFSLVQQFYNEQYFNKLRAIFERELTIESSATVYVIYLAKYLYNIDIPSLYISNIAQYDFDYPYDKNTVYDNYTVSLLPIPYFKRLCKTILNFKERRFNLQFFTEQVAYLCNVYPSDVHITLGVTPYEIKIDLPLQVNAVIYKELIVNYFSIFAFPVHFKILEITFREIV